MMNLTVGSRCCMSRWALRPMERSLHGRARRGFVLPVVMFALIIMSVVAIAAFRTAERTGSEPCSLRTSSS